LIGWILDRRAAEKKAGACFGPWKEQAQESQCSQPCTPEPLTLASLLSPSFSGVRKHHYPSSRRASPQRLQLRHLLPRVFGKRKRRGKNRREAHL
jgi:hypothetical protein